MFDLPLWLLASFAFFFGAIMGSFLDVCASRFHTGKSINGRSRCMSCGHTLEWYELFPLFSFLFLRGRCRVCQARIPARLVVVEVLTGALFVLVVLTMSSWAELLVGGLIVALAVVITIYDIRHLVIPNIFVIAMGGLAVSHVLLTYWPAILTTDIFVHLLSGAAASVFYGSLWVVSRGRWLGLGDVKLAFPLGCMLSVPETFSFIVLSFWVGAAISVTLLLLQWLSKRGQVYLRFLDIPLTMKSEVPFAPFLLIAFALVYFLHVDVFSLFILSV